MKNRSDFKVTGSWVAPEDQTRHRIELAPTSTPGVMALRDTYEPEQFITVTRPQLERLARPVIENRLPPEVIQG